MKFIRNCDVFSKPVLFTSKRKPVFSSLLGGFLSLLIFLMMIAYFIILITDPWKEEQISGTKRALAENNSEIETSDSHRELVTVNWDYTTKVSKTYVGHDYSTDPTVYNPFLEGFNFAVKEENGIYDPTSYAYTWLITEGSKVLVEPGRYCQKDKFPASLSAELDILSVDYLICPDIYSSLTFVGDSRLYNNQTQKLVFLISYA